MNNHIYVYMIYTPNLGMAMAVQFRGRDQGAELNDAHAYLQLAAAIHIERVSERYLLP